MNLFTFADYCAEHGCEGAELTSYYFAEESDDYLIRLKRHCFLRGIAISGTAIGNNFSMPKGPKLDAEIAATKKWIDRAAVLGTSHVRVFAGIVPKDVPQGIDRAAADKIVIESLAECGEYAGKRGIFLGLENHDSISTAAALLPMVKAVNSPWVGVNLDSGNFHTPDPYKDFAECVPYAVNVQIKVDVHPAGSATSVPADLKRHAQLLREGGYQGWIALEYEAKEDSAVAVPRTLAQLRELFAG
jgi:sugar phosphate isomerase/epimerase